MVSDKRRKQASAAGKASGEKRSRETNNRNRNLAIAYIFLKGGNQSDSWNKKARDFLRDNGAVLDDESLKTTQILADCTGLSVRRIEQILKEYHELINDCFGVSKEEIRVIDTVSGRLVKAREDFNGYTLNDAAARLGISPAKLRQFENGKNMVHIPLSVIKKASEIYGVSTDYFFGVVREEDDVDIRETIRDNFFNKAVERMHYETLDRFDKKYSKLAVIANEVQALARAVIKIQKTALRVMELNPGADINLKGGDNVSNSIREAVAITHRSTVKLVRAKLLPRESLKEFR
jgi:transcriptional regulator with XRE-family HTH domain